MPLLEGVDILDTTRSVLSGLASWIRTGEGDDRGGLIALIDVVGDIGRALSDPDAHRFPALLPELAGVREALEVENARYDTQVAASPSEALRAPKVNVIYAAGALWAASTIIDAVIDARRHDRGRVRGRASRAEVRDLIVQMLARRGSVRPGDIRAELDAGSATAHPSTISRAFSDLVADEVIQESATATVDRRARVYEATERGSGLPFAERLELRAWFDRNVAAHGAEAAGRVAAEEHELACA